MTTVFVSYRREDTAGEARALFNELSTKLGKESVFMDVDNIALGRDFRHVLQEHLAACDLLLVIVGRGWVEAKDGSGRNRLELPNDFVRLEIETALKRNIPVTPVLVQGAQMPSVDQLPDDVKDFAYRNGFELSHARWESDVAEMCKRLGLGKHATGTTRTVDTSSDERPADGRLTQANLAPIEASTAHKRNRNPWLATIAPMVMVIAAAGAGLLYYRTLVEQEAEIEQARVESAKAKAEAESKIAALKAEADKARADAEAKALADDKVVKDAADRAEKERAAAAAAQAEKERIEKARADRAEKQRAEKARADQAEKERAEKARADQAEKERVEKARADQAEKERAEKKRLDDEKARASAAQTAKFYGSVSVSLATYARSAGLKQSELSIRNTQPVCSRWARELALDKEEDTGLAISCGQLSDFANVNGWQLGTRPTPQDWMRYCKEMADKARNADFRSTLMKVCLKYR